MSEGIHEVSIGVTQATADATGTANQEAAWFALKVRTRSEPSTASALAYRGYELFFPIHSEQRRYCDRTRFVDVALFPGYLFCRFGPGERAGVLSSPGVQYVVGSDHQNHSIPERVIESIRLVVASGGKPVPYFAAGQRARIIGGAMNGVEGIFQRVENQNRIVLSIALLQRSVAVKINPSQVQVI